MKFSKLLFLTFGLICFTGLYGQNKVKLGLHAGVTYSSLRFEDDIVSEHDSEIDYLFGVNANIYLSKRWSFQTEINYERKLVSVFSPEFVLNGQVINSFRIYDLYEFVTIPLTIQYDFSDKSPFYVKGGFFASYFLKARERINEREWSDDLSQYFSEFDSGISLGIGKIFDISERFSCFMELRNHLGTVSIESEPHFEYTKTNSLSFIFGWQIKI
ncbi:porin family protein [Tenacibaculum sp. 190524A05c]|uniref:porin family protein n=1 Tax=Tenacibaculum platacis TaxID=3137852 RepID=UPI0032B1EE91